MIKEKTETVKQKITVYICDFCGVKVKDNIFCCGVKPIMQCQICKKLMCKNHRHLEYDYGGYHPSGIYCKGCWDKGSDYRTAVEDLTEEFENKKEELYKQWVERCIREAGDNP